MARCWGLRLGIFQHKMMSIIVFSSLLLLCSAETWIKMKSCSSFDYCKAYSGYRCGIGEYLQVIVKLAGDKCAKPRYYPFCVRVDQFTELYLDGSFEWITTQCNYSADTDFDPPMMSVIIPRNNNDEYPPMESIEMPFLGSKSEKFTWPTRFTVSLNMKYGVMLDNKKDAFTFESMCDSDKDCEEFSTSYKNNYLCIDGKTCSVVEGSTLENDLKESNNWKIAPKDVKLFVAFSGTDNKASSFKSSSFIPSKFTMLSFRIDWEGTYSSMADKFQ